LKTQNQGETRLVWSQDK